MVATETKQGHSSCHSLVWLFTPPNAKPRLPPGWPSVSRMSVVIKILILCFKNPWDTSSGSSARIGVTEAGNVASGCRSGSKASDVCL